MIGLGKLSSEEIWDGGSLHPLPPSGDSLQPLASPLFLPSAPSRDIASLLDQDLPELSQHADEPVLDMPVQQKKQRSPQPKSRKRKNSPGSANNSTGAASSESVSKKVVGRAPSPAVVKRQRREDWTSNDMAIFFKVLRKCSDLGLHKKAMFEFITTKLANKSIDQVRAFWYRTLNKINQILEPKDYKVDISMADETIASLLCYYNTMTKPEHTPLRLKKKPFMDRFRKALHSSILRSVERLRKKRVQLAEKHGTPSGNAQDSKHQPKKQLFQQRHSDSPPTQSNGRTQDDSPPSITSAAKGMRGDAWKGTKKSERTSKSSGRKSQEKTARSTSTPVMPHTPSNASPHVLEPGSILSSRLLGETLPTQKIELQLVPRTMTARSAVIRIGFNPMLQLEIVRSSLVRKVASKISKRWKDASPVANGKSFFRLWPAGDRSGHPGYGIEDASVTIGDICDRLHVVRTTLKLEYDWIQNVATVHGYNQQQLQLYPFPHSQAPAFVLGPGRQSDANATPNNVGRGRLNGGHLPAPSSLEANVLNRRNEVLLRDDMNPVREYDQSSIVAPVLHNAPSSSSSSSPFSRDSAFFKAHGQISAITSSSTPAAAENEAERRKIIDSVVG